MSWKGLEALVYFLLTPVVLRLASQFPITRNDWPTRVPLHFLFSILFVCLVGSIFTMNDIIYAHPRGAAALSASLVATGTLFWVDALIYVYWSIIFVGHAFDYYRQYQSEELRSLRLETQLVRAQLQTLRAQLQPHFLFNSLQTVQTYMHEDVEKADLMITHLGDFLRSTLKDGGEQEVTLRRELETLNYYLQIELMRFDGRLRLDLDIEQHAWDAHVPNLILQPLVENAIRHGIAPHTLDGCIKVKARRVGETLSLQLWDNGPGIPATRTAEREGIGLANTRARLGHLYGAGHQFELKRPPEGGFVVDITIPYREA